MRYLFRFKIKCIYGVYNIATLIGQVVMFCFSVHYFLDSEGTLVSISHIVLCVSSLFAAISLIRLAKRWPALVKIAEETEQSLTMLELDNHTIKKSNVIAYVMIVIFFVIYILSINFSVKFTMACLSETKLNEQVIATFAKIRMSYIFNYVSYSAFKAALAMIFAFQTTFLWSFIDVCTICFSIYITSYFHKLNNIIRSKKNNNTISWGQLREHYSKLALLVKEIDAQFCSTFILLSFFTDLFYICLHLFSLLHLMGIRHAWELVEAALCFFFAKDENFVLSDVLDKAEKQIKFLSFFSLKGLCAKIQQNRFTSVKSTNGSPDMNSKKCGAEIFNNFLASPDYFLYHYTSFYFLILRSIFLSWFAANVHSAAQKPIIPVYIVQFAEYDQEVQRFQLILRFTTVALSGKFFYVTRNTILQAISTIITYELVLLQFSTTRREDDLVHNTTTTI